MRRFYRLLILVLAGSVVSALLSCSSDEELAPVTKISSQYAARGAGGSFALPLYGAWAEDLNSMYAAPLYAFRGVGSAEGLVQFLGGEADFGSSDIALGDEVFESISTRVLSVPMTAGLVALAYNLGESKIELKFSRDLYPAILSGQVSKWNDPKIAALNPGADLPEEAIELVVRVSGSGLTAALSSHLSRISEAWAQQYGETFADINWPSTAIPVETNRNVAEAIAGTPYSLGYVDYGVARQMELPMAHLQNKAGKYIAPGLDAGRLALEAAVEGTPASLAPDLSDPDHPAAYPIIVLSSVFFHDSHPDDEAKSQAIRLWVAHGLSDEQQRIAPSLGYIPLPTPLLESAREMARASE